MQLYLSIILVYLIVCQTECLAKSIDGGKLQPDGGTIIVGISQRDFKPSKLLDFEEFKALYDKQYSSLSLEESVRRKIFLANVLQVHLSELKYKFGFDSSYLGIYEWSDSSNQELDNFLTNNGWDFSNDFEGADVIVKDIKRGSSSQLSVLRRKRSLEDTTPEPAQGDYVLEPRQENNKKPGFLRQIHAPGKDKLVIDLRKHGCWSEPRNQGQKCDATNVFAAVGAIEWSHCKHTGERVAFSEQYAIDCGIRNEMNSCNGGLAREAFDFFWIYGLEPLSKYPWQFERKECQLDRQVPPESRGTYKISRKQITQMTTGYFDKQLPEGPIMARLWIGVNFFFYKGGVKKMSTCGAQNGTPGVPFDKKLRKNSLKHKILWVLIVGHGIQDGDQEYWLLRAPFGREFGENGYFKFAKDYPDCFRERTGHQVDFELIKNHHYYGQAQV